MTHHDDRALPASILEAIRKVIHASQMFGSASGRDATLEECQNRMDQLHEARRDLGVVICAALQQRYEAGLELRGVEGDQGK